MPARFPGVDLLVIREITEDLYTAIEHEIVPGVVQSIKVVTEAPAERFFRFAFAAGPRARPQDGPLRPQGEHPEAGRRAVPRRASAIAEEYPDVGYRETDRRQLLHADGVEAAAVRRAGDGQPLRRPAQRPRGRPRRRHLRGARHQRRRRAVACTRRSTAKRRHLEGTGRANPLPLLSPAIDLLRHLGEGAAADRIAAAVTRVLEERRTVTPDLGGTATTQEMAAAIVAAMK